MALSGLATVVESGASALPAGTQMQVKIVLRDNGSGQHKDMVDVKVTQFLPGTNEPLVYNTGNPAIQQVQILEPGH